MGTCRSPYSFASTPRTNAACSRRPGRIPTFSGHERSFSAGVSVARVRSPRSCAGSGPAPVRQLPPCSRLRTARTGQRPSPEGHPAQSPTSDLTDGELIAMPSSVTSMSRNEECSARPPGGCFDGGSSLAVRKQRVQRSDDVRDEQLRPPPGSPRSRCRKTLVSISLRSVGPENMRSSGLFGTGRATATQAIITRGRS
jgi:hypothetical protein